MYDCWPAISLICKSTFLAKYVGTVPYYLGIPVPVHVAFPEVRGPWVVSGSTPCSCMKVSARPRHAETREPETNGRAKCGSNVLCSVYVHVLLISMLSVSFFFPSSFIHSYMIHMSNEPSLYMNEYMASSGRPMFVRYILLRSSWVSHGGRWPSR